MRWFFYILAFITSLLTGCAQDLKTSQSSSIFGTWQGVSRNKILLKPEDRLIYERYYPDGRFVVWYKDKKQNPLIPKSDFELHGTYHFDGRVLVLDSDRGGKPERTVEIKKDEMTTTIILKDGETEVLISHHIVPDLDPGIFPSDQSTNGASKL
jgi:hypothetical protein